MHDFPYVYSSFVKHQWQVKQANIKQTRPYYEARKGRPYKTLRALNGLISLIKERAS